jgi:hypothetical protein
MGRIEALRSVDGQNPVRAKLAEAINAETAAKRDVDEARDAVTRARKNVDEATAKIEAARAEASRTKDAQAARAVAAAKGGTSLTLDRATREARARETEAADDLEAFQSALAICETALTEAEGALQGATKDVATATAAVMADAINRLVKEAEELQKEVCARRIVLHYLWKAACTDEHGRPIPGAGREQIDRVLGSPFLEPEQGWRNHPAADPWRQAHEQLLCDPNAPLPTI